MNNPINVLMQMMNMGNNPQTILQNVIRQNPQYQVALNQMQSSGLSPRDYVMQYARQCNIDLQPMINVLAQNGMKL